MKNFLTFIMFMITAISFTREAYAEPYAYSNEDQLLLYATIMGGYYVNQRCHLMTGKDDDAFNIKIGKIKGKLEEKKYRPEILDMLQRAGKDLANSNQCEQDEKEKLSIAVTSAEKLVGNEAFMSSQDKLSPANEDKFISYGKIATGYFINNRCHFISGDAFTTYSNNIATITVKFRSEVSTPQMLLIMQAGGKDFANSYACDEVARQFVTSMADDAKKWADRIHGS
jgi:hypothetical protein